jgi:hypothetical protein
MLLLGVHFSIQHTGRVEWFTSKEMRWLCSSSDFGMWKPIYMGRACITNSGSWDYDSELVRRLRQRSHEDTTSIQLDESYRLAQYSVLRLQYRTRNMSRRVCDGDPQRVDGS